MASDDSRFADLADRCNADLRLRHAIVLVARCTIEYWGRSRSVVGEGDRIILVKPDSTLIVHAPRGFKPLNWMSAPADTVAQAEDDVLVIASQRTKKPFEEMRIEIRHVHGYHRYPGLHDAQDIEVRHTERDMQDYLACHPELVDPAFRLTATEYHSPLGFIDLYGKLGERYCVVELKVERAGLPAALQVKRYRDWLAREMRQDVEAILIAPAITPNALQILKKEKIAFKKFSIKKIEPTFTKNKTPSLADWCETVE